MSLFSADELRRYLSDVRQNAVSDGADEAKAQKITRRAFVKWLDEYTASLREELRAIGDLPPEQKEARRQRAKRDFHFFRRTYLPHYYRIEEKSELQTALEAIYHAIITPHDTSLKYALAAPRGHGKSTDVMLAFVLWVVVFHFKHFITLFSDAVELAEVHIEAIKAELEENPRLRADFPEACGEGSIWRIGDIVTKNGVRIKAFGQGKRVRGIKHGTYRPDLALIDDLENDENVRSLLQRDKLEAWLDAAVDNLGGVGQTLDIIYIGTILHRDSVLSRKLKLAFWHPRIFRAVISYPDRMDLWDAYERIYRSEGQEAAHAFYIERKARMDAGAKLLWSAAGLEALMQKRIANHRAFERELQNNPIAQEATFRAEMFRIIQPSQMPRLARTFLYTDFKGDSARGDYFARIAGGFDAEGKTLYVYYSQRDRIKGRKAVEALVELYRRERFYLVGGETNGGFYVYRDWFKEKCVEKLGIIPNTRFLHMREKKEERIAELEFPITDGDIVFVGEHPELFRELEAFPESPHDDLSDALAGLWRLAKKRAAKRRRRYRKPLRRNRFGEYT